MSVSYPETPKPVLPGKQEVEVPNVPIEDVEEEEFDGGPGEPQVVPAGQSAPQGDPAPVEAGGEPSDTGQDGSGEAAGGDDTTP